MLGLPQTTEVKRSLPKAQLYRQFDWNPAWRDAFDAEVSRLDFVHWIAPKTVPAIAAGAEVKEIFVVEVELKQPTISKDNLLRLFNSISTNTTRYGVVNKFENLYKIINGID